MSATTAGGLGTVAPPPGGDTARQALRQVTSGVTVLTVIGSGLRHGTTVSALITMSRDPLIVGVCLRPTSTFASMIRRVGLFSVNVLANEQATVARRFADPARIAGDAQFAGLEWTTDELTGAPLISGCLAHMACQMNGWHQVGDHDLLLAEVIGGTPGPGLPLVNFAGRLHRGMPDLIDTPIASEAS
ncbi:flavin reductase family protein [Sphaerisporangium sp. TRM90804]|uniref:flavin reductase family protein n=1 Tax=Sphaerisporangium sp. TRM90804 TaxID=3031113 RepID=UPI002449D10E|nr:flavin reductase family protein [Sphaerisporangium sp. TRM90804]MDH2428336.1 flavin reductase family protein [Sphaerisporangium sp. TRM90804]